MKQPIKLIALAISDEIVLKLRLRLLVRRLFLVVGSNDVTVHLKTLFKYS